MKTAFYYKVLFQDEFVNYDEKSETGIVMGDDYQEAMDKLVGYYGQINSVTLEESAYDCSCIPMSEEMISYLKEKQIW